MPLFTGMFASQMVAGFLPSTVCFSLPERYRPINQKNTGCKNPPNGYDGIETWKKVVFNLTFGPLRLILKQKETCFFFETIAWWSLFLLLFCFVVFVPVTPNQHPPIFGVH